MQSPSRQSSQAESFHASPSRQSFRGVSFHASPSRQSPGWGVIGTVANPTGPRVRHLFLKRPPTGSPSRQSFLLAESFHAESFHAESFHAEAENPGLIESCTPGAVTTRSAGWQEKNLLPSTKKNTNLQSSQTRACWPFLQFFGFLKIA